MRPYAIGFFLVHVCCSLAVLAQPASARAALPTWEEMQGVLRKPIADGQVKQFVARFGLGQHQKFDSGSFANPEKTPVSLLYRQNKVDRIVVRLSKNPGQNWPIYTGDLLLGLRHDDTPEDVIKRLGQPVHQPLPDYLLFRYKTFDLVLTFDQNTHKLAEIDLDAPFRKFNRTEPSAYDKMDEKAIDAAMERLVEKLNAVLPPGWRAARGLATNVAPDPDADQVRIAFKTAIWKKHPILPNSPPDSAPKRVKEVPYLNLYLLPKWRQDEATHMFEDCPFLLYDERSSLTTPEDLNRQYDEALKGAEKVLTKQPETNGPAEATSFLAKVETFQVCDFRGFAEADSIWEKACWKFPVVATQAVEGEFVVIGDYLMRRQFVGERRTDFPIAAFSTLLKKYVPNQEYPKWRMPGKVTFIVVLFGERRDFLGSILVDTNYDAFTIARRQGDSLYFRFGDGAGNKNVSAIIDASANARDFLDQAKATLEKEVGGHWKRDISPWGLELRLEIAADEPTKGYLGVLPFPDDEPGEKRLKSASMIWGDTTLYVLGHNEQCTVLTNLPITQKLPQGVIKALKLQTAR